MFSCVDVDLYLFLRNASVHKNRLLFRSSFFLKTIIELFSSSSVSLLISEYLLLSFNELLDIIIREVVSTCDEIWELFCKKIFWEQDARTESFVIDALTEESLTEDARIESFVIDALTEESLTDESFRDRSFVNDAFLDSISLTKWFLNLLNVDSIILDVWYSSI
jgi:predicted HTH domain antitoxin